MIHLDPTEMKEAYRSAVLSADLLRRSGEPAKAARLESLARILARGLETMPSSSFPARDGAAPVNRRGAEG